MSIIVVTYRNVNFWKILFVNLTAIYLLISIQNKKKDYLYKMQNISASNDNSSNLHLLISAVVFAYILC